MQARDQARPEWIEALVGLIALGGVADSILLTIEHYKALTLPCTFTQGCETVLTSRWASIGPIPTSALGIIFYGVILFAVIFAVTNQTRLPRLPLLVWASLGFASSVFLTFLQAFVIHAWCQYCLLSGLSSTLIFILAIVAYLQSRSVNHDNKEEASDEEEA